MNEYVHIASSFCAVTNPDSTVLYVLPRHAHTSRLLRELRTEFPLLRENMMESTDTEITLENGSRVLARSPTAAGGRLRGLHPDLLITDTDAISEDVVETVLEPMQATGDCTFIDTAW